MNAIENDPLLAAVNEMNEEALTKAFDLYSSAIYSYVRGLYGNGDMVQADNTVGDVFSKLLDNISRGNGPKTHLKAWLFRTAYHLVIDSYRDSKQEAPLDIVENTPAEARWNPVECQVEEEAILRATVQAMRTELTDDQRNVITLRLIEGFSIEETAEILDKTATNIKVIQNRGIARLRKALRDPLEEEG